MTFKNKIVTKYKKRIAKNRQAVVSKLIEDFGMGEEDFADLSDDKLAEEAAGYEISDKLYISHSNKFGDDEAYNYWNIGSSVCDDSYSSKGPANKRGHSRLTSIISLETGKVSHFWE